MTNDVASKYRGAMASVELTRSTVPSSLRSGIASLGNRFKMPAPSAEKAPLATSTASLCLDAHAFGEIPSFPKTLFRSVTQQTSRPLTSSQQGSSRPQSNSSWVSDARLGSAGSMGDGSFLTSCGLHTSEGINRPHSQQQKQHPMGLPCCRGPEKAISRQTSSGLACFPVAEKAPVKEILPLGVPFQGCSSAPMLRKRPHAKEVEADASLAVPSVSSFALAKQRHTSASTPSVIFTGAASHLAKCEEEEDEDPDGMRVVSARKRGAIVLQGQGKQRVAEFAGRLVRPRPVESLCRHEREEVLERDRQRTIALYGGATVRLASPARSHGCSLFFSAVNDSEEVTRQLPQPFQIVGRPSSRQAAKPQKAAAKLDKAPVDRKGSLLSEPGRQRELSDGDVDAVFDRSELPELVGVIDGYAQILSFDVKTLTQGPPQLQTQTTTRKPTANFADAEAALEREKMGPVLSRAFFCRLMLASGLCNKDGPARWSYHEVANRFDERAQDLGTTAKGLHRGIIVRLLAQLLVQQDPIFVKAVLTKEEQHMTLFSEAKEQFMKMVPKATAYLRERENRLQSLTEEAEDHVNKGMQNKYAPLSESKAANIWPPLPPTCVDPSLLEKGWNEGIKQWEEETVKQEPLKLMKLRAMTETIMLGETLSAQLLEPEVLHFTARFKPLFINLFSAYRDWPAPFSMKLGKHVHSHLRREQMDDQEEKALGHMSFQQFYRFCVDFGLYPDHVNFEECQKIYRSSETVIIAREEDDDGQEVCSKAGSSKAPSSKAGSRHHHHVGSSDKKHLKNKRMDKIVACAAVAAVVASEAAVPQVDFRFFEKPLQDMTSFEVQTVGFFAAVDQLFWERSIRVADVLTTLEMDASVLKRCLLEIAEKSAVAAAKKAIADLHDQEQRTSGYQDPVGHEKQTAKQAASAAAMAVESLRPTQMLTPKSLLDILNQTRTMRLPEHNQVDQMFRLLLNGADEYGEYGTDVQKRCGLRNADGTPYPGVEGTVPVITVFQMDKVMSHARDFMLKARCCSCALLQTDAERSAEEQRVYNFFHEMSTSLFNRSKLAGGVVDDVFADCVEINSEVLSKIAWELGVSQKAPEAEDLAAVIAEVVGRRDCVLDKKVAYRALAFVLESQRRERQKERLSRLSRLTPAAKAEGPTIALFGVAAFVESLLRIALHRLGSKGSFDIQRGSPAWWKCTWLLTYLTSSFNQELAWLRFEKDVISKALEGTSWVEAFDDQFGVAMARRPSRVWFESKRDSRGSSLASEAYASEDSQKQPVGATVLDASLSSNPVVGTPNCSPRRKLTRQNTRRVSDRKKTQDLAMLMGRADSKEAASPTKAKVEGRTKDAEVWWRKVKAGIVEGKLAVYMTPMEWLAVTTPDIFHADRSESELQPLQTKEEESVRTKKRGSTLSPPVSVIGDTLGENCKKCGERPTKGGWGNPNCVECSRVDSHCLPIEQHLFRRLFIAPEMEEPPDSEDLGEESEEAEDFPAILKNLALTFGRRTTVANGAVATDPGKRSKNASDGKKGPDMFERRHRHTLTL